MSRLPEGEAVTGVVVIAEVVTEVVVIRQAGMLAADTQRVGILGLHTRDLATLEAATSEVLEVVQPCAVTAVAPCQPAIFRLPGMRAVTSAVTLEPAISGIITSAGTVPLDLPTSDPIM